MTQEQRDNFIPNTPVERAIWDLSNQWEAVTEAAYVGITNPVNPIQAMGDFATDRIISAAAHLRETFQRAHMALNVITEVWETPCEDDWTVVVETALPAAGAAMWLILIPSPKEVLEEYLSPKTLRGGGRGGRDTRGVRRYDGEDGRRKRRWLGIPDVDSLIADNLPGSEAVQGRDVGFGQRWLFTGIQTLDRGAWNWMVLDIAQEFFTLWSSGMREARFCSRQWQHLAQQPVASNSPGNVDFQQGGDPADFELKNVESNSANVVQFVATNGDPRNAAGTWIFGRTITFTKIGSHGIDSYQIRWHVVERTVAGTVRDAYGPWATIGIGATVEVAGAHEFEQAHELQINIELNPPNTQGTAWDNGSGVYNCFAATL